MAKSGMSRKKRQEIAAQLEQATGGRAAPRTASELEALMQAMAAGQQVLGAIVNVDLPSRTYGPDDDEAPTLARIASDDLRALVEKHGFSADVTQMRMTRAIARTLRDLVAEGLIEQAKVDKATNNRQRVVFILVRKEVDEENDEVEFLLDETRVIWHKNAGKGGRRRKTQEDDGENENDGEESTSEGELEFTGPLAESILRPLVEGYRTNYLMPDVSERVVLPILKDWCAAFPIYKMGGAYFVPAARLDVLKRLSEFLADLGATVKVAAAAHVMPILDNAMSRDAMGAFALRALVAEIQKLEIDLKEMETPERLEKLRKGTAAGYQEQVDALVRKATLLSQYSEFELQRVSDACGSLMERFAALEEQARPTKKQEKEMREERLEDEIHANETSATGAPEAEVREERLGASDADEGVAESDEDDEEGDPELRAQAARLASAALPVARDDRE